jgi:hypothetical protein
MMVKLNFLIFISLVAVMAAVDIGADRLGVVLGASRGGPNRNAASVAGVQRAQEPSPCMGASARLLPAPTLSLGVLNGRLNLFVWMA